MFYSNSDIQSVLAAIPEPHWQLVYETVHYFRVYSGIWVGAFVVPLPVVWPLTTIVDFVSEIRADLQMADAVAHNR